jgi:hypothetical protein
MVLILSIFPHGRLIVTAASQGESLLDEAIVWRIACAFARCKAQGLLQVVTRELQTGVPPEFVFARDFTCRYLTRRCHAPEISNASELAPVAVPDAQHLVAMASAAPPMRGLEYLGAACLAVWWSELDGVPPQPAAAP